MLGVLISALPMIVCGVLSVLTALSLFNRRNRARVRLLLFMLTATVLYLAHFVYFNRQTAVIPLTDMLYCFCNPAVFPLYYLYIEELTEYRPNRWRQALCLLPSVLCFLAVGLIYLLMDGKETTRFVQQYLYGNEFSTFSGLPWWQGVVHTVVRIVFAIQIPLVLYFGFRRIVGNFYFVSHSGNLSTSATKICSLTLMALAMARALLRLGTDGKELYCGLYMSTPRLWLLPSWWQASLSHNTKNRYHC